MEENKIFIVVDNLELRDGDKVKGFCGLFFQAEKALDYVIENQKKSHDLEVITYPIPLSYEEIEKKSLHLNQIPILILGQMLTHNPILVIGRCHKFGMGLETQQSQQTEPVII